MRLAASVAVVLAIVLNARAALSAEWVVDPGRSRIGFSGVQTGTSFKGRFDRFDAAIDFDPAHPDAAHVTVTVDLASARTGDAQRDTALPGADWFDIAHGATARFDSVSVQAKGPNSFVAAGHLTIRGQTRPVTLPFTLRIDGTTAHATGHAELVRTAFGVGRGPWSSGQWVALAVGIDVDIVASKKR